MPPESSIIENRKSGEKIKSIKYRDFIWEGKENYRTLNNTNKGCKKQKAHKLWEPQ